jgi:hypothetical protein
VAQDQGRRREFSGVRVACRTRLPWKEETAGYNPAHPTKIEDWAWTSLEWSRGSDPRERRFKSCRPDQNMGTTWRLGSTPVCKTGARLSTEGSNPSGPTKNRIRSVAERFRHLADNQDTRKGLKEVQFLPLRPKLSGDAAGVARAKPRARAQGEQARRYTWCLTAVEVQVLPFPP